jgi:multidrug efflux pump subunit AcrB
MEQKQDSAITKFSLFFIKNWRVSLLIVIGTIVLGLYAYTNVLKRESMPSVEIPTGIVAIRYLANDEKVVNEKVTIPVEEALSDVKEVAEVRTITDKNFVNVIVRFKDGVTSSNGMAIVEDELKTSVLPENAVPAYIVIDAAKIDNINDLIFTVSGEGKTIEEMQSKATMIAAELSKLPEVSKAELIPVIKDEINPRNGETVKSTVAIGRVGYLKNGDLVYVDAVNIGVVKKDSDVGTIQLSESVRAKVTELTEDNQLAGYKVTFNIGDQATALNEQIDNLQTNAIEALIIVLIVVFLFIGFRSSLVTVLFIPLTFAATFLGFVFIDYSINTLTLFGLVLVLGLFVDDAIVIIEAIDAEVKKGVKSLQAVKNAVNKVSIADISGTVTTMLVFVPMALITGVIGEFIRILPVTVILALGLSLIFALSVIVWLSKAIVAHDHHEEGKKTLLERIEEFFDVPGKFINAIGKKLSEVIASYVGSPTKNMIIIGVTIALIAIGAFSATLLPFSVFPAPKDGDFIGMNVSFPEGTSIETAKEKMIDAELRIKNLYEKEIEFVTYYDFNQNGGFVYLDLTSMKEREITAETITAKLNESFDKIKGASISAFVPSAGPGSSDYAFQMQIYSENIDTLNKASTDVKEYIMDIELQSSEVEDVIIENISTIAKVDGKRFAQVKAKLSAVDNQSGDLQTITDEIKKHYTEDKLTDLSLEKDALGFDLGLESELVGSFNSAVVGMLIAIIAMYVLLVLQFNSFVKPLLIFLGIPFSFVLLFPGLVLTQNHMSFFVVLGVTALTGIVVNNLIMLLEFIKDAEEEGLSKEVAVVNAIKERFRPILSTSTITVAGLIPLAINEPFWASLALTLILGLISSTTLVLTAFPAYYMIFARVQKKEQK